MTKRKIEMYQYRQTLVRLRLGDSDRECWRRRQIDPGRRNLLTHLYSSKPKPRLASFRFRWVSRDRQDGSI